MRKNLSFLLFFGLLAAVAVKAMGDKKNALQTVSAVNLERYAGKWFEIARLPNRFQKSCAGDVTATYTLRDDGKVDVLNSCREDSGKMKSAKGKAKVVDKKTNAKLKVTFVKSFFFWPFGGDYWVIELGQNYEYAVVASGRDYLWILSRTPQMDERLYSEIVGRLSAQGFEVNRLMRTEQRGN